MHHFIFPTSDSWISSGSSTVDGESFKDQNFGKDQILEIKKNFYNDAFDYQTRALIDFSGTEFTNMSQSIVNGDITNPKFYLKLYEAEGNSELSEEYTLHIQAIDQSWKEGTGKFGDRPKNTNGVSWENREHPVGGVANNWTSSRAIGGNDATGSIYINQVPSESQHAIEIRNISPENHHNMVFVGVTSHSLFTNEGTNFRPFSIPIGGNVDKYGQALKDSINEVGISASNDSNYSENIKDWAYTASYDSTQNRLSISASNTGVTGNALIITSSVGGNDQIIYKWNAGGFTPDIEVTSSGAANGIPLLGGGTDTTAVSYKDGPKVLTVSSSNQSFSKESPDIEVEVTDMVNMWLQGQKSNYGMQIRFSGSQETDSTITNRLKFFSRNTHTIYQPRLEIRWDDHSPCTGSNTGSLNELTMSGLADNYLYMRGLRESYKENDRVKFRVGARKRYIQKTFSNSVQTVTGSFIPEGSGSYAIKDVATDEYIVPFGYTSMSCDSEGPYFNQWLDGFYPDRVYKILLKLNYDDGQEQIFDDDFEFIVKRR